MEMKIADLMDMTSILRLKLERLELHNFDRHNMMEELYKYDREISLHTEKNLNLKDLYNFLYLINGWIWTLEADLRANKLDETDDETIKKIGQTAIKIRNNNKLRIYLKNEITKIMNDGVQEIKGDHLSA